MGGEEKKKEGNNFSSFIATDHRQADRSIAQFFPQAAASLYSQVFD